MVFKFRSGEGKSEEVELKSSDHFDVMKDPEAPERPTWGSKTEFILSCVGYTVGLGNVWRFPYLAYKSGGGAFLIPYVVMLITSGIPMYIMEVAMGQYMAEGPIGTWRIVCPLMRGIGYSMLMVSFLVSIYYNVIIGWVLFYLFASFRKDVPWKHCDPKWASAECTDISSVMYKGNGSIYNSTTGALSCLPNFHAVYNKTTGVFLSCMKNVTSSGKRISPSDDYFHRYVTRTSDGIDNVGDISWQLALCLLLAWVVVYFCMWKGVQSAGKVVYFTATFPYIVLGVLLVRGLTLDNALQGIIFYIKPNFTKIAEPQVWASAGGQLFYSLGPAFGSLLSFASYNKFTNNCVKDAAAIACVDCFTSSLAGFVIFSVLGFMASKLNVDIADVVDSGPSLAFIVYPEGISQMPVPILWSVLFFFMLFTLGLDSQFGMMECIVTNLIDEYPRYLRRHKELFILIVCFITYMFGLTMVTKGGIYVFNMFDYQSAGISLVFIALAEMITVGWFFGTERLTVMIEQMIGSKPSVWWTLCWKYFTPGILTMVFTFSIMGWSGISYRDYVYPKYAELIGWLVALASMVPIPLLAIISMWKTPGTLRERFYACITPNIKVLREKALINGVEYREATSIVPPVV